MLANPKSINIKRPSYDESVLLDNLSTRVKCSVQKKSYIVNVDVLDQDPVVCAQIADSARWILEEFVQRYYSKKAENEKVYYKLMASQKREDYKRASKQYVNFADSNRDLALKKREILLDALKEEMNMQYTAYSNLIANQIESDAKAQELKPVLFTLKKATAALKPCMPDRVRMIVLIVMKAFYLVTVYVLCKEKYWRRNVTLKL